MVGTPGGGVRVRRRGSRPLVPGAGREWGRPGDGGRHRRPPLDPGQHLGSDQAASAAGLSSGDQRASSRGRGADTGPGCHRLARRDGQGREDARRPRRPGGGPLAHHREHGQGPGAGRVPAARLRPRGLARRQHPALGVAGSSRTPSARARSAARCSARRSPWRSHTPTPQSERQPSTAASGAVDGPWSGVPSGAKWEPWHGQSHTRSVEFQRTRQPRCGQTAERRCRVPVSSR